MKREARWEQEWDVLRAERETARLRWRSAADGLAARAKDPFGIGRLVHDHPVAAAGIGVVVGTLLVKFLLRRARATADDRTGSEAPPRPAVAWQTILRDTVISIGVPWLLSFLKEKFGWDAGPDAAPDAAPEATPDSNPAHSPVDAAAPTARA